MKSLEIILVALSLAMDCFAVSVTCGAQAYIKRRIAFRMALFFGLFQAGMFLLGAKLGSWFNMAEVMSYIDHWMAFGLLLVIGLKMAIEALKPHDDLREFRVDHWVVLLSLSVATSIDAFVVGMGLAFDTSVPLIFSISAVGLVSIAMALVGFYFGRRAKFVTPRLAEFMGGMILIAIGVKILVEHLWFC